MKKKYCANREKYKSLKALKFHTFKIKQFFLLFVINVVVIAIKYLKKKNLHKYRKFLV